MSSLTILSLITIDLYLVGKDVPANIKQTPIHIKNSKSLGIPESLNSKNPRAPGPNSLIF